VKTSGLEQMRAKYARIAAALNEEYGYPTWRQHYPPVDEMMLTFLSQNTSDTNSLRAFEQIKARYAEWEAVRDAQPGELIDTIRSAGLANQKGPRMQAALRYLTETQGRITLDHLQDMPVTDAKRWLTSINGIGPKTAAIILLFSMNKPAYPVDTHVHRVTRRLGLVGDKTTAEQAHVIMEQIVPEKDYYASHLQIIQHGREVCHARNPRCGVCVLQKECDYFNQLPAGTSRSSR